MNNKTFIHTFARAALLLVAALLTNLNAWAAGDVITLNSAVLINSSNRNTYENNTVTGTVSSNSYVTPSGLYGFSGAIVVDGIDLNLTIEDFNVDYSSEYSPYSGISLVNGAKLHLTVKGTNTLKAGYGGAGISVPEDCELQITASSDGTLNAIGGNMYGGGAGIGDIGDATNANDTNHHEPRSMGTVIIDGGTVNATGGTYYEKSQPFVGSAGIGSSFSSKRTGVIIINGGTVTATAGFGSAGIGGGNNGTVQTIRITGGTVTATSNTGGAAIGAGCNTFTEGSGTVEGPDISITGGIVTANGNIGYGGSPART